MTRACPVCDAELIGGDGIGPVCQTKDCPVLDDWKLWSATEVADARRRRNPPPAVYTQTDAD